MKAILLSGLLAAGLLTAQTGFVRVSGKNFVTPDGKPILLRGINLGNWLVPEGYMFHFEGGPQSGREIDLLFRDLIGPDATGAFWREWREHYITRDDLQLIRRAGFNSARIPIHYELFGENGPGFPLLDRVLGWCREAGLYAVIDLHAAPAGQTGTNIDDSFGYPWLFESEAAQKETAALWRRIAARYARDTTVLGYDLLNEPIPHFGGLPERYNGKLEPLYRRLVAAVREVDTNHVVFLGGAQWNSNFKVFGAPFDRNSAYTFHKYWTAPTADVIREYMDYRDLHDVPLWMGESGENKDEWVAAFVRTLEKEQIGWCFWPYKKMDATSSVVSFARPVHWARIVEYAKLPGGVGQQEKKAAARPSLEETRAAMADLLRQIRFDKRRVNEGYVKALGMQSAGL